MSAGQATGVLVGAAAGVVGSELRPVSANPAAWLLEAFCCGMDGKKPPHARVCGGPPVMPR